MSANNTNLFYFFKQFPDEESCRKYLEKRRWGDTPTCPHCGNAQKIYRYKNGKTFKCTHCKKQFSVKTGTMYENSNIPLQKWFLTSYLIALSKKGISSIELSKTIGVTQKIPITSYVVQSRWMKRMLVERKRANVVVVLRIKLPYLVLYNVVDVYPLHLYQIRSAKP